MKCVLKKFLFALVFAGFAFAEAQDSDEPSVSKFRERFSLRFLCDYNFVAIWNSAYNNSMLNSNRPIDVGIGVGYDSLFTTFGISWDVSADFKYSLPFTTSKEKSDTQAFETGLDFFPGNWWLTAKLRFYSGFTTEIERDGEKEQQFIDLWFADMYFSMLWMATAKGNFAIRSAYFLDRRQKKSAGSLIIGGRLQRNIAEDNDGVLDYENDKRDITSIWGDVGYTYTFVFSNGYFWNLWGVVGIAYGRERIDDGNLLLPESDIKTALGYIGEKWAWNIVLKSGYSAIAFGEHLEQKYIAAFEILVVRRF